MSIQAGLPEKTILEGSEGNKAKVNASGQLEVDAAFEHNEVLVEGHIAAGSAIGSQKPVYVGGSDGTDVRALKTDTEGRVVNVGAAAGGVAVSGAPVLIGGSDGTDARTILTTATGLLKTETKIEGEPVVKLNKTAAEKEVKVSEGKIELSTEPTIKINATAANKEVTAIGHTASGSAVSGNPLLIAGENEEGKVKTFSSGIDGETITANGIIHGTGNQTATKQKIKQLSIAGMASVAVYCKGTYTGVTESFFAKINGVEVPLALSRGGALPGTSSTLGASSALFEGALPMGTEEVIVEDSAWATGTVEVFIALSQAVFGGYSTSAVEILNAEFTIKQVGAAIRFGTTRKASVTASSTEVIKENTGKKGLSIQNIGTEPCYLGFGEAAKLEEDMELQVGSSWNGEVSSVLFVGKIYAIAKSTGAKLAIVEV